MKHSRRILLSLALSIPFAAGPLAGQARPAREIVADAVKQAAAAKKILLVKFSASWCGPCRALDRFLNDTTGVGAIMHSYFIPVGLTVLETDGDKVALNNPGGDALSKEMGNDLMTGGIPFFYMLDGKGLKLGDSKAMPDGSNIGYPEAASEVEAFDRLLQKTVPAMSAGERSRIRTFLDKAAGRTAPAPRP